MSGVQDMQQELVQLVLSFTISELDCEREEEMSGSSSNVTHGKLAILIFVLKRHRIKCKIYLLFKR